MILNKRRKGIIGWCILGMFGLIILAGAVAMVGWAVSLGVFVTTTLLLTACKWIGDSE